MNLLARLIAYLRNRSAAKAKREQAFQCRRDLEWLHARGQLPQEVVDELLIADDDYLISEREYLAPLFRD